MSTGTVSHDLSVIGIGRNSMRLVSLYAADTATTTVVPGDLILSTTNGYIPWDGTAAGAVRIAAFDATITGTATVTTKKIQAITAGEVDETTLKLSGVAAVLTEAQKNQLADYGIEPILVAESTSPGDSNPSEV